MPHKAPETGNLSSVFSPHCVIMMDAYPKTTTSLTTRLTQKAARQLADTQEPRATAEILASWWAHWNNRAHFLIRGVTACWQPTSGRMLIFTSSQQRWNEVFHWAETGIDTVYGAVAQLNLRRRSSFKKKYFFVTISAFKQVWNLITELLSLPFISDSVS